MNLQVADRQLTELEQSLASISVRVVQIREGLAANQAELERLRQQDAQVTSARKKAEKELAEGETRIRNQRMRLNLVRNEKELQALAHEVDALKESNSQLEATALGLMEGQDARTGRIVELTEAISSAKAEAAKIEKELAKEFEDLKSRISAGRAQRDKLAEEIPAAQLSRYQAVFAKRAGIAVAVVKAGTCMGCRRMIPPQLFNEVQKLIQIHSCPNCQRMLYFEA
jgi:hypothetical protein